MIDISSCLPISGWMSELELQWLAEQASKHERIIEVGSWCGRSTRALALHTPGEVWAVDLWEYLHGVAPVDEADREEASKAYSSFLDNIGEFMSTEKVFMVRQNSVDAAIKLWTVFRNTFDMVFIDGAHDYDSVYSDIMHYRPLIAPGGMLCGHDSGHAHVSRVVREIVIDPQFVQDTQLWWTTTI